MIMDDTPKTAPNGAAAECDEALEAAKRIHGYPVLLLQLRASFNLTDQFDD